MCNKRGIVHTLTRLPGAAGVGTARHGSELEAPKIARVRPVAGPGRAGQLTSRRKHAGQPSCLGPHLLGLSRMLPSVGWDGQPGAWPPTAQLLTRSQRGPPGTWNTG